MIYQPKCKNCQKSQFLKCHTLFEHDQASSQVILVLILTCFVFRYRPKACRKELLICVISLVTRLILWINEWFHQGKSLVSLGYYICLPVEKVGDSKTLTRQLIRVTRFRYIVAFTCLIPDDFQRFV